jgi:hypothetical protein
MNYSINVKPTYRIFADYRDLHAGNTGCTGAGVAVHAEPGNIISRTVRPAAYEEIGSTHIIQIMPIKMMSPI